MIVLNSTLTEQEIAQLTELTLRRRLRLGGRLKGLWFLAYAITETVKNPQRTGFITKDLYPEIAKHFGTTASRVERDTRTAVNFCWENSRTELEEIVGYPLQKRPTNTEFIDYIATYIRYK